MARDAIAFLDALDLAKADLLDFSIGSFVVQEIALIRPSIVRRLVLASSAPRGRGRNAQLGDRRQRRDRRTEAHPRFLDIFKSAPWQAGPSPNARPDGGPGQANNLGNLTGPVRRGVRLGHLEPRAAAETEQHSHTGLGSQRRQRPGPESTARLPENGEAVVGERVCDR